MRNESKFYFIRILSLKEISLYTGTRKIVIYTWIDWSQRKLWWKIS